MSEILESYVPKIKTLLEEVRKEALECGYTCTELHDMTTEDISWGVLVKKEGKEIDVNITIAESEGYDGTENGMNFMLDVVSMGGRIVAGLIPFNYTDACWVQRDDADAVEERWLVFQDFFNACAVMERIEEFDGE